MKKNKIREIKPKIRIIETKEEIKIIGEKKLEEEIDDEEEEIESDNFSGFFSRGGRTAPILESTMIPDVNENIEEIARTAPPATEEKGEETYMLNAPNYTGADYAERQEREQRKTDPEMILGARLADRERDTRIEPRGIDFGQMQRQFGIEDQSEKEYIAKARRKKEERKLPFE